MLSVTDFLGMVPRSHPEKLPPGAAQQALNCEVTSGSLALLDAQPPFAALHDGAGTGTLLPGIDAANVPTITKPTAPALVSADYICNPAAWFSVFAFDYVVFIDPVTTLQVIQVKRSGGIPITNIKFTETGLEITCFIVSRAYVLPNGGPFNVYGPRYQVQLRGAAGADGGPDTTVVYPTVPSYADPVYPPQATPLVDANNSVYASFQIVDASGPLIDEVYVVHEGSNTIYSPGQGSGSVTFTIDLNYARANREFRYYVQSLVQQPGDREGPPSSISERLTVLPGQTLSLTTPIPPGYNRNNLYRSPSNSQDEFLLIEDINNPTFVDNEADLQGVPVPPFGNRPQSPSLTQFLAGAFVHPANFGVAFFGDKLYLSDPLRLHAWPDEYVKTFPLPILAIGGSGNSVLVFTADTVYSVSGTDPEHMSTSSISQTEPLVSIDSLCKIGDTLYWACTDGLAAGTGARVKLVTSQHFTRETWQFFQPHLMVASAADNSIFLTTTTGPTVPPWLIVASGPPAFQAATTLGMRFDLEEELRAVTTYDALQPSSMTWRSQILPHDQDAIYEYARVVAGGPVTLTTYVEGVQASNLVVATDSPVQLTGALPGRTIEFLIESSDTVHEVHLFDRQVLAVDGTMIIPAADDILFQYLWFQFPTKGTFAGGAVRAQGTSPVHLEFYDEAGTLIHTQAVVPGAFFLIDKGALPPRNLWRVAANTTQRVDELTLAPETHETVGASVHEVHEGLLPPWLGKRYDIPNKGQITSVVVVARVPVQMNIYQDAATTFSQQVAITSSAPARLDTGLYGSFTFDFGGFDDEVEQILLFFREVETVSMAGVFLDNPQQVRRRLFRFEEIGSFAALAITASDYTSVVVDLYVDGVQQLPSITVLSAAPIDLPRDIDEGIVWEVDVQAAAADVHGIQLLPRVPEAVQGKAIEIVNPKTGSPWRRTVYEFASLTMLMSAKVTATQAVTLRLYLDRAVRPTQTFALTSGVETILTSIAVPCSSLEFEFEGDDALVSRVGIFGQEVLQVGASPLHMGSRRNWRRIPLRFADGGSFGAFSIDVVHYTSVDVRFYIDGVIRWTQQGITSNATIVLPRGNTPDGSLWEVDVITASAVRGMTLVPRTHEPMPGDTLRLLAPDGEVPPWATTTYVPVDRLRPRAITVHSDVYPLTLEVTYDDGPGPQYAQTIQSKAPVRLTPPPGYATQWTHSIGLGFGSNNGDVRELILSAPSETLVPDDGVTIVHPRNHRALPFKFPSPSSFVAGQMAAHLGSTAVINFYDAARTLLLAYTVSSGQAFAIPQDTLPPAESWEIDLETDEDVDTLVLRQPLVDLVQGDAIRYQARPSAIPRWMHVLHLFEVSTQLTSITVQAPAAAYPLVVNFYLDGGTTAVLFAIDSGQETPLTGLATCTSFSFHFEGDDGKVTKILVSAPRAQAVDDQGVFLGARDSWLGVPVDYADAASFAAVSVAASAASYPLELTLTADGSQALNIAIPSGRIVRLPRNLTQGSRWVIDLKSPVSGTLIRVDSMSLMRRIAVPVDGTVLQRDSQRALAPWLREEYQFPQPRTIVSLRADMPDRTRVQLYVDGSTTPDVRMYLDPGEEMKLTTPLECMSLGIDFDDLDPEVRSLAVYLQDSQPVGPEGVREGARANWRGLRRTFDNTGVFACGSVELADASGTATLTLTSSSGAPATINVTSGKIFAVPRWMTPDESWDIDIESNEIITGLTLVPRTILPADRVIRALNLGAIPQWMFLRHELPAEKSLRSCRVVANPEDYPLSLLIYVDGAQGVTLPVIISDHDEVRLDIPPDAKSVEFDFGEKNHLVNDLQAYVKPTELIGPKGIDLPDPQSLRAIPFRFDDESSFAMGYVEAQGYPLTLKLYGDGKLRNTTLVEDADPFLFPRALADYTTWELDIQAPSPVSRVRLLPRSREPVAGNSLRVLARDQGLPSWLHTIFDFPGNVRVAGIRVEGAAFPLTINLYANGETAAMASVAIPRAGEVRVSDATLLSALEFEFGGTSDTTVAEVIISLEEVVPMPVIIREPDPLSVRGRFYKFPDRNSLACFSIGATDYDNVYLRLYADRATDPVYNQRVRDGHAVQLPLSLAEANLWEIDIDAGTASITDMIFAPWRREPVDGHALRLPADDNGFHPWLFTKFQFPEHITPASALVVADGQNLRLDVYGDGSLTPVSTQAGTSREFALNAMGPFETIVLDIGTDLDHKVNDLSLWGLEQVPLSAGGFVLRGAPGRAAWMNKELSFPVAGSFGVGRVQGTDYTDMKLALDIDGVEQIEIKVYDSDEFRFPDTLVDARTWRLRLSHVGTVSEVILVSRQFHEVQGQLVTIGRKSNPLSWLGIRISAQDPISFSCARVVASGYPLIIRLFNEGGQLIVERTVQDETAFRLPSDVRRERQWVADVVVDGDIVVHELSLATSMRGLRSG